MASVVRTTKRWVKGERDREVSSEFAGLDVCSQWSVQDTNWIGPSEESMGDEEGKDGLQMTPLSS